jgi:hypothetical protein
MTTITTITSIPSFHGLDRGRDIGTWANWRPSELKMVFMKMVFIGANDRL